MMMMNGMIFEDNMSNLTSGSNELASISSSSRNEVGSTAVYPQKQSFASTPNQLPAAKKKRNLPGNPDPDSEVVALSPRTLMATNRFICEICNKGFQRDQNLQLHRRGHNLPWKLKQRANKEEVVKKVYVCPEATCVHHEPSRALGDLTGIKKHFSRKHGEKKWNCEKCSKRYAVRSDWKAHSKICGTREYRCDCGTLFSRRDSFITHRAFCGALAEESTRSLATNPLLSTQLQQPLFNLQSALIPLVKREQDLPQPWLASQPPSIDLPSPSSRLESNQSMMITHHPQNPSPGVLPRSFQPYTTVLSSSSSPHMSATALLQKAAQMSAIMSSSEPSNSMMTMIGPHQADDHMIAKTTAASSGAGFLNSSTSLAASTAGSGAAGLSSPQGLSFGNKPHVNATSGCMEQMGATTTLQGTIHDMMIITTSLPSDASSTGFGRSSSSSFEEAFNGMFNPKMGNFEGGGGGGGGNKGLSTRDFLGLRGFSHSGFPTLAGLDQINSSPPFDQRNQN